MVLEGLVDNLANALLWHEMIRLAYNGQAFDLLGLV